MTVYSVQAVLRDGLSDQREQGRRVEVALYETRSAAQKFRDQILRRYPLPLGYAADAVLGLIGVEVVPRNVRR